jgi:glycosyltransferase involved in cell wall biosynthesis
MEYLRQIAVLIPAYKPDEKLIKLAEELLRQDFFEILIVDDGGGAQYQPIFTELSKMGCRVLVHAINMGKGRAMKTGFNDLLARGCDIRGVVTADADGQHLVKDIIRISDMLLTTESTMVLGKRKFADMPLRSRCGNTITRSVFNFVSGQKITDTQTGLRGFPTSALPALLALSGDRYEYEMNMLLEASSLELKLAEIEIETVYIDNNRGSHFNAWKDSWRIYKLIILFIGSSLFSFLLDYGLYVLFLSLVPKDMPISNVVIAYIAARIISSVVNFLINRNVIFAKDKKQNLKRHLIGYYLLVICIMIVNTFLVRWLSLYVNEYIAKLPVELVMFFVSFIVQKKVIFK